MIATGARASPRTARHGGAPDDRRLRVLRRAVLRRAWTTRGGAAVSRRGRRRVLPRSPLATLGLLRSRHPRVLVPDGVHFPARGRRGRAADVGSVRSLRSAALGGPRRAGGLSADLAEPGAAASHGLQADPPGTRA